MILSCIRQLLDVNLILNLDFLSGFFFLFVCFLDNASSWEHGIG